ncbi:MAG: HAD family hydrolase [Bacillota bacterium]
MVRTAVFFDLDDTLYDLDGASSRELWARLESLLGDDRDRLPEALEAFEAVRESTWQEYMAGRLTFEQVRVARFLRVLTQLNLRRDPERVQQEADRFVTGWMQSIQPFPGVAPLLTALKERVALGLITNGNPQQTQTKLGLLGLDHCFDPSLVLASEAVGRAKPDRFIFDAALERAGVPASRAIMVGDSLEADIQGSLKAGWAGAVWFNRKGRSLAAGPLGPQQRVAAADSFSGVAERVSELADWLEYKGGAA